ncbi:MAG: hypothetical protein K0Q92_1292 [Steroidobacteraceae bacterium]|jgi:hypothetical protein|nr:hypothetical protein [Steroidobacteraceae bacterium]
MKKFLFSCLCILLFAAAAFLLPGCGGGGENSTEPATGRLTLAITDAPVDDATAVVVKFTAIELKPEAGDAFTIDLSPAQSIDLLALAGGSSRALLQEREVPAGRYQWVRLLVETQENQPTSYIDLESGTRYPLVVPSGAESGLKLIRGFTVAAGSTSNFTIDFDLRKSVIAPPGQAPNYLLKPVLRMVDNLAVGAISGTVAPGLVVADCEPQIYLFTGAGTTPDDLDSTPAPDVDPLISVPAELDVASGEYRFRLSFVEVGAYTASFTCDGDLDSPEGEETLVFAGTQDVNVSASQTTVISFVQ